jgi:hypothetical protein
MGSLVGRPLLYTLAGVASQPLSGGIPTFHRDFVLQLPLLWSWRQILAAGVKISIFIRAPQGNSVKDHRLYGISERYLHLKTPHQ